MEEQKIKMAKPFLQKVSWDDPFVLPDTKIIKLVFIIIILLYIGYCGRCSVKTNKRMSQIEIKNQCVHIQKTDIDTANFEDE